MFQVSIWTQCFKCQYGHNVSSVNMDTMFQVSIWTQCFKCQYGHNVSSVNAGECELE